LFSYNAALQLSNVFNDQHAHQTLQHASFSQKCQQGAPIPKTKTNNEKTLRREKFLELPVGCELLKPEASGNDQLTCQMKAHGHDGLLNADILRDTRTK